MMKRFIGEHAELLIDICRQGDGLWFDGGELSCLIKTIGTIPPTARDSQERVLAFIGDSLKAEE
jgi:Zn-finger nucleic acid-binding protein